MSEQTQLQAQAKSDFEAESWGPQGVEFARFHLNGSQDVTIFAPYAGSKEITVELIDGADWREAGGTDMRRRTVLRLPKARARAVASAIMGAAAEV